jgi:hypothetical protein
VVCYRVIEHGEDCIVKTFSGEGRGGARGTDVRRVHGLVFGRGIVIASIKVVKVTAATYKARSLIWSLWRRRERKGMR